MSHSQSKSKFKNDGRNRTGMLLKLTLWLTLSGANLIDQVQTHNAILNGKQEMNPVANILLANIGFDGLAGVKIFFLALLLVLLPYVQGWKLVIFSFTTASYTLVAMYHFLSVS